ncbi:regulator of chromosome condensation 1/beta-lactamase-inhibitor protein II [Kockiozyma suomiensis]|uniref:regulator of chromosome condensation 1/beta-lactamase-inhibitor protein II n=1 Tax=Kockiozyma suomiensis TaxID=1337062 RepID=UPI0033432B80
MTFLSFGSNSSCQLSQPVPSDLNSPTIIPVANLPTSTSTVIRSNGNHTLLLDRDRSRLYATGSNEFGQCFIPCCDRIPVFQEVKITDLGTDDKWYPELVAAGWEFSVVVATTDDKSKQAVFVAGFGLKGELALDEKLVSTATPTRIANFVPAHRRIVQVSAGLAHVVVLLDDGALWGWGNCRKGQLGSANSLLKSAFLPVRIIDERIPDCYRPAKVICGREFTGLIDANGHIIVLMDYSKPDRHNILRDIPAQAQVGSNWKDFQCGWTTLHVLLSSGKILSWGNNSHCQYAPEDAPIAVSMSCGSEHTLIHASGGVYVWGWGEHGNCGNSVDLEGGNVNVGRAVQVYDGNIMFLGAGCATSWICTE